MTRRNPKPAKATKDTWAPGRPLPAFANAAEEEAFWLTHDFDDAMEAGGTTVLFEPHRGPRRARAHVYRVRLDDAEMSKLRAIAQRRGVTASVVLRELVRAARVAPASPRR